MAQDRDLRDMLSLLIDHPLIQQYYHVDVLPERKPLVLALDGARASGELGLMKFGVPVVIAGKGTTGPGVLNVTLKPAPDGELLIEYSYPVEGIVGSARFVRKDGNPALEGFRIIER